MSAGRLRQPTTRGAPPTGLTHGYPSSLLPPCKGCIRAPPRHPAEWLPSWREFGSWPLGRCLLCRRLGRRLTHRDALTAAFTTFHSPSGGDFVALTASAGAIVASAGALSPPSWRAPNAALLPALPSAVPSSLISWLHWPPHRLTAGPSPLRADTTALNCAPGELHRRLLHLLSNHKGDQATDCAGDVVRTYRTCTVGRQLPSCIAHAQQHRDLDGGGRSRRRSEPTSVRTSMSFCFVHPNLRKPVVLVWNRLVDTANPTRLISSHAAICQ